MLTQQRHEIILKLLREKGSITVTEVRDLLDTSESMCVCTVVVKWWSKNVK